MAEESPDAAVLHEEVQALRAEVVRLRRALAAAHAQARPQARGLFEGDPDLPGLSGLWRGERGPGWRLFVQGAVAVQVALAVLAGIAIVH